MHLKRLAAALILLPIIYFIVTAHNRVYFMLLIGVIAFFAQYEFLSMYNVKFIPKCSFSIISPVPSYLVYQNDHLPLSVIILTFSGILFFRLFFKRSPKSALMDISAFWVGFIYISVLLSYLLRLRAIDTVWLVYLGAIIWGSDACAFYIGNAFGKKKLYEDVSPNKTVIGAFGAVSGGVLISLLLRNIFRIDMTLREMVVLGLILAVIGIIGDFIESMFKRDAGVKDSSHFIPGHGGILDKIDGILFSAPVLYYFL